MDEKTSKFFNLFLNSSREADNSFFQSLHMSDLPRVEDLLSRYTFHHDIDLECGDEFILLVEGSGEVMKASKSYQIITIFTTPTASILFSKLSAVAHVIPHFPKLLTLKDIWSPVVSAKNKVTQRIIFELRETLFHNLDAFKVPQRRAECVQTFGPFRS